MIAAAQAEGKAQTKVRRTSDREIVVTRTVAAPARIVFQAWSRPELFQRWWAPQSHGLSIAAFEADVRAGGSYRLEMRHPSFEQPMAFFGRYLEVVPPTRLVWTNEEAGEAGQVTTVTFEESNNATHVTVRELYPSKEALNEAMGSGSMDCWDEQFTQLETVIAGEEASVRS